MVYDKYQRSVIQFCRTQKRVSAARIQRMLKYSLKRSAELETFLADRKIIERNDLHQYIVNDRVLNEYLKSI